MVIEINETLTDREKYSIVVCYLNKITLKDVSILLKKHNIPGRTTMLKYFGRFTWRYNPTAGQSGYFPPEGYSKEGQYEVAKLLLDNGYVTVHNIIKELIDHWTSNPFGNFVKLVKSGEVNVNHLDIRVVKTLRESVETFSDNSETLDNNELEQL